MTFIKQIYTCCKATLSEQFSISISFHTGKVFIKVQKQPSKRSFTLTKKLFETKVSKIHTFLNLTNSKFILKPLTDIFRVFEQNCKMQNIFCKALFFNGFIILFWYTIPYLTLVTL